MAVLMRWWIIRFARQMKKYIPFSIRYSLKLPRFFPFAYIHVGGDECAKNFWEKSDAVKQLMQKENLKTHGRSAELF